MVRTFISFEDLSKSLLFNVDKVNPYGHDLILTFYNLELFQKESDSNVTQLVEAQMQPTALVQKCAITVLKTASCSGQK